MEKFMQEKALAYWCGEIILELINNKEYGLIEVEAHCLMKSF
jgi:hypothetical protein